MFPDIFYPEMRDEGEIIGIINDKVSPERRTDRELEVSWQISRIGSAGRRRRAVDCFKNLLTKSDK